MQGQLWIRIKMLGNTTPETSQIDLHINNETTVLQLKQKIEIRTKLPIQNQILVSKLRGIQKRLANEWKVAENMEKKTRAQQAHAQATVTLLVV